MKVRFVSGVACAIAFAVVASTAARAAEARPWLCRSKPVFSSDSAMKYHIVNRGSERWQLLLMQFQMGAAHDGYEVVASQELPASAGQASGTLAPGRYFAVAMYRNGGGRWICPGYAENKDRPAGAVSRICYDEDSPGCPVALTVFSAAPAGASAH
ncbi:MAG TPA: hypothetical protein VGI29_06970 [Candidatus Binataceae bacterium]